MRRPGLFLINVRSTLRADGPRGFTLVEMLVATTLTLILMGAVVTIFGLVGESISDSRATLEMTDRLRAATTRLHRDLEGLTASTVPPLRPEADEGYFEYIEGPIGPVVAPWFLATRPDPDDPTQRLPDTTVADTDDVLMFTTRSRSDPFVGRFGNTTIESQVAEVIWFVRGRTLYRRVLLVAPGCRAAMLAAVDKGTSQNGKIDVYDFTNGTAETAFYEQYDISVRAEYTLDSGYFLPFVFTDLFPNTLGDLTKRENRFAHTPDWPSTDSPLNRLPPQYPHAPHGFPWDPQGNAGNFNPSRALLWSQLRMPTLRECSYSSDQKRAWRPGLLQYGISLTPRGDFDAWSNPHPWNEVDPETGTLTRFMGSRVAEDVILTNVIGFDVKAWDPGAPIVSLGGNALVPGDPGYLKALKDGNPIVGYGAYVDLNYMCLLGPSSGVDATIFSGPGEWRSGLRGTQPFAKEFNNAEHWPAWDFRSGTRGFWFDAVYDTWSLHYEHDGHFDKNDDGVVNYPDLGDQDQDGVVDEGTNGFDDDTDDTQPGYGLVDDASERETSPPYPVPLRGIQVKVRVFEPDSRQIREVTVVQDFLDK